MPVVTGYIIIDVPSLLNELIGLIVLLYLNENHSC